MAKPKKKLTSISVPSQIITSLSSSSLQSLLVSPKKSSSKPFFTFPSPPSYRSSRRWFLALFLVGLLGMLKVGFDLDPLTPFSPYPCPTSDGFSRSQLAIATAVHDPNARTNQILRSIEEQQPSVSRNASEESEFWKQPDGLGYRPCLVFSPEYRKASQGIVKNRRKYLVVVVSGGMNQQRNQIVDAVVIARVLGASLVVPISKGLFALTSALHLGK